MADMNRTVGIGQGGGNEISFKILHDSDTEMLAFKKVNKDNKFKNLFHSGSDYLPTLCPMRVSLPSAPLRA